jgi:hypothetical protein
METDMTDIVDIEQYVPTYIRQSVLSGFGELRARCTHPDIAAIIDSHVARVRAARTRDDIMAATTNTNEALLGLLREPATPVETGPVA